MAVMQNSLIFGGVNTADYGVYISGEGIFNAPNRDVEMIAIPGRNGSFALDHGRFENITVTYPAFTYETTMATFKQQLAGLRNALSAQRGYQRLTDTFHTDEYRMASFNDGIEIKPVKYNTASEFNITFECKPQRWLTSGETKITVTDGDTVANPTLFDASPLLEVTGYGAIGFNNSEIDIVNSTIGQIQVLESKSAKETASKTKTYTLDLSQLNTGDDITVSGLTVQFKYKLHKSDYIVAISSTSNATATANVAPESAIYNVTCNDIAFVKGTSGSTTCTASVSLTRGGTTATGTEQVVVSYDGSSTLSVAITINALSSLSTYIGSAQYRMDLPPVVGDSTVTTIGNPTYIDLDIGEAYNIENGTVISVNNSVQIPAELPTFAPGANIISFDNTITDLKVIPRWWRV